MSGFNKDGVSAAIIGSDGNGVVKESMKVLDSDGFVIAASSNMEIDIEDRADFLEKAFEGAAVVNYDQSAKPTFKRTSWTRRRARL